jgi:heptosyltransferase-2
MLVIRAPNWVGDVVMATPVFHAALLGKGADGLRIIIRSHLAPLLSGGPLEALLFPIRTDREELEAYRQLAPQSVLVLSSSLGAAMRAWRARVPVRAGMASSGRQVFLTHAYRPRTDYLRRIAEPTAQAQRNAAKLLGIEVSVPQPVLHVRGEDHEAVRSQLSPLAGRPYMVVFPGAAGGRSKLWPARNFAAATKSLSEAHGLAVVVGGGPGEEPLMSEVAAALTGALNLATAQRSLHTLKALVAGARLVLVGDSGPRWVAAAFGVPCVSVMGPNLPELTATSLERARIVRRSDLPCAPCMERECPLGHHACLSALPPDAAVAAANELLTTLAQS